MKSGTGSRVRMNETTEEEPLSSCTTGQRAFVVVVDVVVNDDGNVENTRREVYFD